MEYKTVRSKAPETFDAELNKAIGEGWELFGTPFFADPYYVQCMTRGTGKSVQHIYRVDLSGCKNIKEASKIQEALICGRVRIFDGNDIILFKFNKD